MSTKALANLPTPKLERATSHAQGQWYPYYAGFSPRFVADVVSYLDLSLDQTIVDPWNGSGTTTRVALSKGHNAAGFDLNPALVLVAKARILDRPVAPSIPSLAVDIVAKATTARDTLKGDYVETWLELEAAQTFRALERSIYSLLVDQSATLMVIDLPSLAPVSSLAAFFYVVLFRTLRQFLRQFHSSNPTWIRKPRNSGERLAISTATILSAFLQHSDAMRATLDGDSFLSHLSAPTATIDIATSTKLPLANQSVDAVITSPPYCTRIDYAVASLPELALLGIPDDSAVRRLRDQMIGTPTLMQGRQRSGSHLDASCTRLLDQVASHRSRASSSYYYRQFCQYFIGLRKSLVELKRVLRPNAPCVIVVQDSYYKEIRIDLASIVSQMASRLGFSNDGRLDFPLTSTRARINAASRNYRTDFRALESVLVFSSPGPKHTRLKGR